MELGKRLCNSAVAGLVMRKIAQERWFEWKIILVLLLSRSHLGQAQSLSDTFAGGLQNGISQVRYCS